VPNLARTSNRTKKAANHLFYLFRFYGQRITSLLKYTFPKELICPGNKFPYYQIGNPFSGNTKVEKKVMMVQSVGAFGVDHRYLYELSLWFSIPALDLHHLRLENTEFQ